MKKALLFLSLLVLTAAFVVLNNIEFPYRGIIQLVLLLAIAVLIFYIVKTKRQV